MLQAMFDRKDPIDRWLTVLLIVSTILTLIVIGYSISVLAQAP